MIKYLLRRTAGWLAMIFVATNVTYFLASAFLSPRSNYQERRPPLPEATISANLDRYNLNDKVSIFTRWWRWISDIALHWDWGKSPVGESVNDQISFRAWNSFQLVIGATVILFIVGVSLGVYAAVRQYSVSDRVLQLVANLTYVLPVPVAATLAVLGAIALNKQVGSTVFFVTGSSSLGVSGFFDTAVDKIQHLTLPSLVLIVTGYAGTQILQRSLLLDTLSTDYVRMARAKGLTQSQAVRKHALRTALIPTATSVAFSVPAAFTGAVLTESIFAWNGMGSYFIQTISKNDVHGVVATAAFGAALTAVGAILADFLLVYLDPRIRVS
ncbi:ABC transporter permease [Williamsia sp. CHRR-6]|uniref:ABC transporter permease n=1 Tax=Williamsia sp. CHRR-6 TaxID=2835871 RepID=UPI001BDAEE54|nr:ABC transporter permease [Williamsia sp. CHRR-6]MBT0566830.1 ABC transporter permease [Williamsia sp. CHRR-6]